MSPEHSDGLDDAELPARTVAAGETRFERLRRIALYSGTACGALGERRHGRNAGIGAD